MTNVHTQMQDHLSAASSLPATWPVFTAQLGFQLQVVSADTMACALDEINFAPHDGSTWSTDQIRQLADQFCERVTYLMEPLKVVEFDSDQVAAQARSTTPTATAEHRSYFELSLSAPSATLRRYTTKPGQPRQHSSMTLTQEVLKRLLTDVDDLAAGCHEV